MASSSPYQQFTRSYIRQQIHYVRAFGDAAVLAQKPRTQQLLGWYTRVVTTLDEYYRPEHERLYRKGQGRSRIARHLIIEKFKGMEPHRKEVD